MRGSSFLVVGVMLAMALGGCLATPQPSAGATQQDQGALPATDTSSAPPSSGMTEKATANETGKAAPAASAGQAGPGRTLSPGDHWDSSGSVRTNGVATVIWTTSKSIKGTESLAFQGATVEALRVETLLDYKDNTNWRVVATTTEWVRPDDQAVFKTLEQAHATRPGSADRWENKTTTYDAACLQMRWPLHESDSWETHCTAKVEGSGGSTSKQVDEKRTVGGMETVEVAAGTFQAYRVAVKDLTKGTVFDAWYAPKACDQVKLVPEEQPTGSTTVTELKSFSCAQVG